MWFLRKIIRLLLLLISSKTKYCCGNKQELKAETDKYLIKQQ
jgi:hypothetical protein